MQLCTSLSQAPTASSKLQLEEGRTLGRAHDSSRMSLNHWAVAVALACRNLEIACLLVCLHGCRKLE